MIGLLITALLMVTAPVWANELGGDIVTYSDGEDVVPDAETLSVSIVSSLINLHYVWGEKDGVYQWLEGSGFSDCSTITVTNNSTEQAVDVTLACTDATSGDSSIKIGTTMSEFAESPGTSQSVTLNDLKASTDGTAYLHCKVNTKDMYTTDGAINLTSTVTVTIAAAGEAGGETE